MKGSRRGYPADIDVCPTAHLEGVLWTKPNGRAGALAKKRRVMLGRQGVSFARLKRWLTGLVAERTFMVSAVSVLSSIVIGIAMLVSYNLIVNQVTIHDGMRTVHVDTTEKTVGDLIDKYAITLDPTDQIEPSMDTPLHEGMEISIRRSVLMNISDKGEEKRVFCVPGSVAEVLERAHITLGDMDTISPSLDTLMGAGDRIEITRTSVETVKETETLAYQTVTKETDELKKGVQKVSQEGKEGVREHEYRVTYANGVEVERVKVASVITQSPTNKIVLQGTKVEQTVKKTTKVTSQKASSSSSSSSSQSTSGGGTITVGGKEYTYTAMHVVESTAYEEDGSRTKTGTVPRIGNETEFGTIAVDPRYIALGTKVYIPGYGLAIAEDTGGAIKGWIVDVYLHDVDVCNRWGRRMVKCYILK